MNIFLDALSQLKEQSRYRSLNLPNGVDLTSNDYLGMASHPDLRAAAINSLEDGIDIGAAGSRLLRGHTSYHAGLEDFALTYFNAPKTLFMANGFIANYALFTTLPSRHDIVLYDALIHASVREGARASDAKSFKFPHNDIDALERLLNKHKDKHIWIATESIYSMDGDSAPIADIYNLIKRYSATLIIDETHATGIYGENGKGLAYDIVQKHGYDNIITLHTCGKAIGVAGGLICSTVDIIDYMINKSRPFIYSTAPMPLQALLVQKSLEILESDEGQKRRDRLLSLCRQAQELFGGAGSQIVPIILGEDKKAVKVATMMQEAGYDIRAIRPPTVPSGTARLRLSLSSNLDNNILQDFADILQQIA